MHDSKDESLGLFSRPIKPGSFALTAREGLSAPGLHMQPIDPSGHAAVFAQETLVRVFLTDAYTQLISPPRNFGDVGHKVRNCLMRSYPQWPSLEAVAEKRHTSPSTLQRHLAEEHTSLQWLKDGLRCDLAISRLSTSWVSLVQLASELGFSDSPTFQRAFKRWTGKHCGAYRRR